MTAPPSRLVKLLLAHLTQGRGQRVKKIRTNGVLEIEVLCFDRQQRGECRAIINTHREPIIGLVLGNRDRRAFTLAQQGGTRFESEIAPTQNYRKNQSGQKWFDFESQIIT